MYAPMASMTPTLIRGIDHVMIHTQNLERVFALFRDVFDLPVVWPVTDYGVLVSGGVRSGNMNIEIGQFAGFGLSETTLYGLAFAPSEPTWQMVNGLVARGILHTPPVTMHYEGPMQAKATLTFLRDLLDGPPKMPLWLGRRWGGDNRIGRALSAFSTWMADTAIGSKAFAKLLGDSMVFMCEYKIDLYEERLAELTANWQRLRGGGPFGITGIAGVDLEISTTAACWGKLLDRPDLDASSIRSFSIGPPLRFHSAQRNRLIGFDFCVADLELTTLKLEEKGWLSAKSKERATVAPDRVEGLTIAFCEARSS